MTQIILTVVFYCVLVFIGLICSEPHCSIIDFVNRGGLTPPNLKECNSEDNNILAMYSIDIIDPATQFFKDCKELGETTVAGDLFAICFVAGIPTFGCIAIPIYEYLYCGKMVLTIIGYGIMIVSILLSIAISKPIIKRIYHTDFLPTTPLSLDAEKKANFFKKYITRETYENIFVILMYNDYLRKVKDSFAFRKRLIYIIVGVYFVVFSIIAFLSVVA